ncbi:MAG: bifunctional diaminohydroxyphosphoribosylaminopyrimidine deaminase/5-amino-6-(5-phosphoribosylamino)uracil reductase RibD [Deltaproteobacteria bacterium]|nr:bifunctional diaminohydroxyphosphoribosylaminopyrimidine deaminase/5-amino-6-(5-phosphoribosylamino)uracil reductase RibD [Deltaproteobacteria bacterium]
MMIKFMHQAIHLALKGQGLTSPNPMVGALVVKQGKVISEGYHHKAGSDHAELIALKKAGARALGATLYVTLEPCCHTDKRTPPCTEAILKYGVKEVVVGTLDPNPKVSGKGVRFLRKNKVKVKVGILREVATNLNKAYNKWIQTRLPYVLLKSAMSLDGKIALANGRSKWITGEAARNHAHQVRARVDGILVGIGTVLADNPYLTVRLQSSKKIRQPRPIVLDPKLKAPLNSHVVRPGAIWIVSENARKNQFIKIKKLQQKGVQVLPCPMKNKSFVLSELLRHLGAMNITSILVEGGATTITHFMKSKLWDEYWVYQAPSLIGSDGLNAIHDLQLSLKLIHQQCIGQDHLKIFLPA